VFGAKAQPASFLGDFCNKICQKATFALQQRHRYSITSSAREQWSAAQ